MLFPKLVAILVIGGCLAAGCASAATAPAVAADTVQPQLAAPQVIASPIASAITPAQTETETPTGAPFVLDLTPAATETLLPTLEIPTEAVRAPALQNWDGLPTYPAESNPNYYFRVQFDPSAWALTTDNFGFPALVHRAIRNCIISPSMGRDLPPNATIEHDTRRINGISYTISSISVSGIRQAVAYTAGDGRIFTAFQVALDERPDQCLLEAETVLGTLRSVPVSEATPIATP